MDSELLGFAPDARVLIVNCDDLGLHDAVNAGIADSIENGIATSCSLMSCAPAAVEAVRLLRERPHIPFGIHLALIRDNPAFRWGPVAARADVPSLLDPDTGELYVDTPTQRAALLAGARIEQQGGHLRTSPPRAAAGAHRMGGPPRARHVRLAGDRAGRVAGPRDRP